MDNEQWVSHPWVGRDILAGRWIKKSRVVEEASSDEDVFQIVCLQPDLEGFGWEAANKNNQINTKERSMSASG